MVPAPRQAGSNLQIGGITAQYWIGPAEVRRRRHNSLDRRSPKLFGRRYDSVDITSHMLLSRGRHTLNYRDATQIWHTGVDVIRMNISEDVANLRFWTGLCGGV